MKKKIALVLLILPIIGTGLFFALPNSSPHQNEESEKGLLSTKQEQKPNQEDSSNSELTEQQETEEKDDAATQIKSLVSDIVEGTIDFFTKKTHVVAIGDSLTQGVGDTTGNGGYVGILDRLVNQKKKLVEFENYGKRGNRSDHLLKRLDKPEIAESIDKSDIVLITIGANDIMKVFKETFPNLEYADFVNKRKDYEKRLRRIFDKINALNKDTEIYLIGFYNPFEKYFPEIKELGMIVHDWNQTGMSVAKDYENVTFIPTIDLFRHTDADLFAADNFHPNTYGYQLMAKRILEYVTENEG